MRTLFSARVLFALSALFIVYGTTIPWDFSRAPTLDNVSWIPLWDPHRGRIPSIPDLVQNVVFFMPFGFFGALALRRSSIATIGLLGLALSLAVELLQTMSAERSPSASDLTTNFAGALIGATAARVYVAHFEARLDALLTRAVRERPGLLIYAAYVAAVSAGALAPFIPTLNVSDLRANVRGLLDHPWGPKPAGALIGDALAFAAIAFLFASERLSRKATLAFAVATTGALAFALEFAQLFIVGHSPGLQDAVSGTIGALIGAAIASFFVHPPATQPGALTRRLPWVVVGFAFLAPAVRALSPFELIAPAEKLADFSVWQLVPFWAFFRNINLATFRNVFEAAIYYVPLGYALLALGKKPIFAFAAALVWAEILEVLQIGIAARTFDTTEGIYAGTGALLGAYALTRLHLRLEPRADPPKLHPR